MIMMMVVVVVVIFYGCGDDNVGGGGDDDMGACESWVQQFPSGDDGGSGTSDDDDSNYKISYQKCDYNNDCVFKDTHQVPVVEPYAGWAMLTTQVKRKQKSKKKTKN